MEFLEWLEMSRLADWASIEGYPYIITAHSIGLAIMVGTMLMIDLRLLGYFKYIAYQSLSRMLSFAWFAFVINFLSGVALFSTQASGYMTTTIFLVKISFVLLGSILAVQQHFVLSRSASSWQNGKPPVQVARVAVVSLVFWIGAVVAGRFIAYLS